MLIRLKQYSRFMMTSATEVLKVAFIQLAVTSDKAVNIQNAAKFIRTAKENSARLAILPECFNSPYGTKYFKSYAEEIPNGETSKALSQLAKENEIYIVGGSIPEIKNGKLYNTCTVWNPKGEFVVKHQKVHLFDIDIPGKITFKESESLSPGECLSTFEIDSYKIGLGICYDVRFPEMAQLYRNEGCHFLIYPAAFNLTTGPLHWTLLLRARAVDNQLYVAAVSPARDEKSEYVAYGHTTLVDPLGQVQFEADAKENIYFNYIDLEKIKETRQNIPILNQRRTDLYDIVQHKSRM